MLSVPIAWRYCAMWSKHDHVHNLVHQLYYWHLRNFKNHLHVLWLRKNIQINTHAFRSTFVFCCQTVNSEPPSWISFLQLRHCSVLDSCLWGQSKISLACRLEMKLKADFLEIFCEQEVSVSRPSIRRCSDLKECIVFSVQIDLCQGCLYSGYLLSVRNTDHENRVNGAVSAGDLGDLFKMKETPY